jgi:hypothetical protein
MIEEYGRGISGIVMVSKLMGRRSSVAKLVSRQEISWLRRSKILIVLAIASLASAAVRADEKPLVNFLSAADGSITCSVTPGVDPLLSFTRTPTTDKQTTIEFHVTPFVGEQGDNLAVDPCIVELPNLKPKNHCLVFSLVKPVMTLKLKVPELLTAGKYSGHLVVVQEDQKRQTYSIVLTRATAQRPAQLTVDPKSILICHTKWWVPWPGLPTRLKEPPSFTVFVRNPSPEWQARGVFLRLLEVTTPEGANFDPRKNLTFTWNDQKADDLWRSPSPEDTDASQHVIAPNQQAEIGGEFRGLAPGEYTLKVGLAATNAVPETEQQMTLKVRVRHCVIGAGVVLLLAIAVSFIATKGLEAQRRRIAVLKKISELRPPWLREEPPTAPVVSVRAILRQAEDRNKSWYSALFGPDVVSDRVNKAERVLGILRRMHQIREQINKWDQPIMIRYRAEKQLTEITADLDSETVNEKSATEIERKLDELAEWFNRDKLFDLYWADVKKRIDSLLCQAKPEEFPEKKHRDVVVKLREQIGQQPGKLDLTEAVKIDEDYAKLKILWECQQDNDSEPLDQLVALLHDDQCPSINNFFKERDEIAWKRLKKAYEEEGKEWLKFTSPQESTIYPIRTYELFQFEVESIPRNLGNNYLFRSGLEYHWSLDLEIRTWWKFWKGARTEKLTRPQTKEPRLVQYVPRKGKLHVSVKLCHNSDCSTEVKMKEPLPIKKSSDFRWIGAFRFVEVTALAIATLFALISGLQTYYIGKPSFGSMVDYVTLFIWGAGVDQAKNFIQHLAQSSTTKGPSA